MKKSLPDDASPLAQEIYARMQALGLNQKRLAIEAGLKDTYVRDIFVGRSKNPKHEELIKLASRLGCTIEDLVGGINIPRQLESGRKLAYKPDEIALIKLWRRMSITTKAAILVLARKSIDRSKISKAG